MRSEPVWGEPQAGLRLGLAADGATAHLLLENVGSEPLEVMSHVAAGGERHFDWFSVVVDGARTIGFADDRDRSAPISAELAPGGSLEHALDLQGWATRPVNGGTPLEPGEHAATAVYEVAREGVWSGRLDAGPATLTV